MSHIELIVEGDITQEEEEKLLSIASIKYKIPLINSFVIIINEKDVDKIKNFKSLKTIYQNSNISMQMNKAREIVKADIAQDMGYSGEGIGVAIVDTGISKCNDFIYPNDRIVAFKDFINNKKTPYDDNGHGTHVAGIAGGNGTNSDGRYKGIATNCNLIGVKVLNEEGQGNASDVLAGLQWIMDNRKKYNIRIVNLSIGTNNTSYNDPLVKAVEKMWDSGIVITIAAGNDGPKKFTINSPAISKKVITIGSSDDSKYSSNIWGNPMVNFSGRGPTMQCVIKPDVLAPGVDIVSCLSSSISNQSNNVIEQNYYALTGTSMSTPIVSGAIALLLEKYPELEPDDVKLMIKKCCKNLHLPKNQQGWGLIDVYKLLSQEVVYARK